MGGGPCVQSAVVSAVAVADAIGANFHGILTKAAEEDAGRKEQLSTAKEEDYHPNIGLPSSSSVTSTSTRCNGSGTAIANMLSDFREDDWMGSSCSDLFWNIAHFPGLFVRQKLSVESCQKMSARSTQIPVSKHCCPTHDGLGSHPGLVFGRSAALGPRGRRGM